MATLSQLPSDVDLAFVAGDTFRIRVRVVDPTSGLPTKINPDGDLILGETNEYNFRAEIRKADRSIAARFAIAPDPQDLQEAVILTLSKTDTDSLMSSVPVGSDFNGVWDLEVTFPNGDVRTVATGKVRCVDDVTTGAPT